MTQEERNEIRETFLEIQATLCAYGARAEARAAANGWRASAELDIWKDISQVREQITEIIYKSKLWSPIAENP